MELKSKIKKSIVGFILFKIYRLLIKPKNEQYEIINTDIHFLNDRNKATFFGYHDKTPFSKKGTKILAMSVNASDKKAESEGSLLKLGYYEKDAFGNFINSFFPFAETSTWAWQQGCMLQWNPSNPDNEVIFNKLVNNQYGSVIFDINKRQTIKEFKDPVYSVSPNGRFAATLNFSRLGRLRPGYGYSLYKDDTDGLLAPENDGLFIISLSNGKKELIVNLKTLADEINNKCDEHYVNHAVFSPDSLKIAFFHRWLINGNIRKTRFLIYHLKNKEHFTLENTYKISHYCWVDDENILATTQTESNAGYKYILYNIKTKSKSYCNKVPLKTDGHPMADPQNNEIIVTDSRLNRKRDDHVFIFNRKNGQVTQVAKFFIPLAYTGQVRCDLHPRWDREGKFIVVDTVKNNKRTMALIDIKNTINKIEGNE